VDFVAGGFLNCMDVVAFDGERLLECMNVFVFADERVGRAGDVRD